MYVHEDRALFRKVPSEFLLHRCHHGRRRSTGSRGRHRGDIGDHMPPVRRGGISIAPFAVGTISTWPISMRTVRAVRPYRRHWMCRDTAIALLRSSLLDTCVVPLIWCGYEHGTETRPCFNNIKSTVTQANLPRYVANKFLSSARR